MGSCHGKQRSLKEYYQALLASEIPLVSIEQAIEPIAGCAPEIAKYLRLVQKKCQNPSDNLSSDQSASIMLYTMAWQPYHQCFHAVLHRALDEFDFEKLQAWRLYFKLFLTALLRLPSLSATIYRPCSRESSKSYPKNERFSWWEFALCRRAVDAPPRSTQPAVFRIQSQSAREIRQHSYSADEDLVLLLPGTEFGVRASAEETIDLEEVRGSFLLQQRAVNPRLSAERNVFLEQLILNSTRSWIVDLDERNLTEPDLKVVVKYALIRKRCKRIRLRDNHVTADGVLILAHGLRHNTALESLDLRGNALGDLGVEYLASAIAHSNLKTLNLESNCITARGASALAQVLRTNRKLTELYLSKNRLGDQGIEVLTGVLREERRLHADGEARDSPSTLQHLYLGQNEITDVGVEYLAEMLKTNRMLTWLWLCGNEIGNRGVELLARILANQNLTLEWLFLNSNRAIDDQCIEALIHMLKRNHSLKTIYVNNCQLSDQAKQRLHEMTKLKKDFDLEV